MTLRGTVLGSQLSFLLLLILIAAFTMTGRKKAPSTIDAEARPAPRDPPPHGLALLFPVAGEGLLTDSFGDPRPGGRRHQGVDIMAPKMTPVVAATDGTVAWIRGRIGKNCCSLSLRHDGGWTTRYLHLNNDSADTDDGRGHGIAPGLEVGSTVQAGQVIGWVGDSGNAETTAPHLHFELRDPEHRAVDPYPNLVEAPHRPSEAP